MIEETTTTTRTTDRGFKLEAPDDAPAEIREIFDWYLENFNFVPNLTRIMSESPALLRSYWSTQIHLLEDGLLTGQENNIVQTVISAENECRYCVSAHMLAGRVVLDSSAAVLSALRTNSELPETKFNALRDFALEVYRTKGRVDDQALAAFCEAGYSNAQALDVVANIAVKVMSNFTNQLSHNELDELIAPEAEGLDFGRKNSESS